MLKIDNLRPGEIIKIVLKRHRIVFVLLSFFFLIWIVISIWMYVMFEFWIIAHLLNIVFWMPFSLFLYIEWLNHELDTFVITNNRIISVEQISFLNRAVSECNLWQVQEVNSRTKWVLANLFNYWSLSIQTAWNVTTMIMDYCPDSINQARDILNIVDEFWENLPDRKLNNMEIWKK